MEKDSLNVILEDLLLDVCNLWSWTFTYDFKLIRTNCPSPNLFTKIMLEEIYKNELEKNPPLSAPLILSNRMKIMFSAVFGESQIWFLGPIYTVSVTEKDIMSFLKPYNLSTFNRDALTENLKLVPVMETSNLFEKTIFLHRLVTGQRMGLSSLRYFIVSGNQSDRSGEKEKIYHAKFATEKNLMEAVRSGNKNYHSILSDAALASYGVKDFAGDPLVQAKYSVVSFITLSSRAAIEGGLPSEIAYTLTDQYVSQVDSCRTLNEVIVVSHRMFKDFIERVHKERLNSGMTRGVRIAAQWIDMNPEAVITLESLAEMTGYSTYYLSKRFKSEVGVTVSEYIKRSRIRHAEYLLSTTRLTLQDISERLHFCSRNYFASEFRRINGQTPAEYRNNKLNI